MAQIFADNFACYADVADMGRAYHTYASIPSGTALVASGSRRVAELRNGIIVRPVEVTNKVCIHAIIDMTAGTFNTSTILGRIGLNPPNITSSQHSNASNARFMIELRSASIVITRRAYTPAGVPTGNVSTLVNVAPPTLTPGSAARLEVMIDESSETCQVVVKINGNDVADVSYPRTLAGQANDAGFGFISLSAQNQTSGVIGRFGDIFVYTPDAITTFPTGPLRMEYCPASAASGVIASDTVYDLADMAPPAGPILGITAITHAKSVHAVTTVNARLQLTDAAGVPYATAEKQVTPGVERGDIMTAPVILTEAQFNGAKIKLGIGE